MWILPLVLFASISPAHAWRRYPAGRHLADDDFDDTPLAADHVGASHGASLADLSASSTSESKWIGFRAAGALLPCRPGIPIEFNSQVRPQTHFQRQDISREHTRPTRGPKALKFSDRVYDILMSSLDVFDSAGDPCVIELPLEWSSRLANVRVVHRDRSHTVCEARLQDEARTKVAVKIYRSGDQETKTYVHMAQRLGAVPGAIGVFQVVEHDGRTYILTEGAEGDLETWIAQQHLQSRGDEERTPGVPLMPLWRSLPILVDMLSAIEDLQSAGILHADLMERNFLFKEGHALISDLRVACLEQTSHRTFGNRFLRGRCARSVFRHAPEMLGVLPTGPSNHIWAVGLIFAKMCLGYVPTEHAIAEEAPQLMEQLDSFNGPLMISRWIRERFDIFEDDGWQELLDPEMQDLIAGMLEKDPNKRWHVIGALNYAKRLAVERGIQLLPQRRAPDLVPSWLGHWN